MPTKVIQLYEPIGEWDMSAQRFEQLMQEAVGFDLELRIHCRGGDAGHGMAIANMVKRHVGKKVAVVDGYCCSAATLPAMYCDEMHMHEMSMFMMHRSGAMAAGHADDLENAAKVLNDLDAIMAAAYKAKSGATDDVVAEWLSKDTWMAPKEAKAAGLCDQVIAGPSRISATALASATQFFASAGRLPDAVRAFMNPVALAIAPRPQPSPSAGVHKMKSTAITRGLLVALSGLAHYSALAAASADPEEKALGEQLAALDLAEPTAHLAEIKDAPALEDLFAVHAKAVAMVGSSDGLVGGLDAYELNAQRRVAAATVSKMSQVNALLQEAVNPPKGKPRKLTPVQAQAQRTAYEKNPGKPLADLETFIRLAEPLAELNDTEDEGKRAATSGSAADDTGDVDADFAAHANAGKVLAAGGAK